MKLLLDEMYPVVLGEQLRARGHDVSAVTERHELRSLPDPNVFADDHLLGRHPRARATSQRYWL